VSRAVLSANARAIRAELPPEVRFMAVVKADAYGHGLAGAAEAFLAGGADALAVAIVEEAIALRAAGVGAPILVLGGANGDSIEEAVRAGAAQAVYRPDMLFSLEKAAEKLGVPAAAHLKIDTGMSRIGVKGDEALARMLEAWRACPIVRMEGAFTHFAAADADPVFTARQDERFREALGAVRAAGHRPLAHAAATFAFEDPRYMHDMVRPGLALYGYGAKNPKIRGAQTLVSRPVRIEKIGPGETVSYGRTFAAARETTVMTLPIGYGDGYPRVLSNRGQALVRGCRVNLVGRVCMDMVMLDVTDVPDVTLDTEVVLMGRQGNDEITPAELASHAGTIPYEIMLGFLPRVRRVYAD
jgi:alanine racemase